MNSIKRKNGLEHKRVCGMTSIRKLSMSLFVHIIFVQTAPRHSWFWAVNEKSTK